MSFKPREKQSISQSDNVKSAMKAKDKLQKANKRASETSEQTVHRREKDRMRASETSEQTVHKQQNRKHMASMRASNVSVQQAIHSDIKNGPDFVCSCCHRLMYNKSVASCKYTKCSNNLLECVFSADLRCVSDTGNEWVCKTCDRVLKRGVMPLQAKANGLQLSEIPPELSDLELRLRVPFMKMVALPSGKQRSIHGPAVNVPSKVDTTCNMLPRLPSPFDCMYNKFNVITEICRK